MHIEEKQIRKIFFWSLLIKGVNGLLETMAGILFLFPGYSIDIVAQMISKELIEDPHDFTAVHLQGLLPYLSMHSYLFAALYLLSHGVIKLVLVENLFRNKLWAYPATIVVLFLFILYQLFQILTHASIYLTVLTIFDLVLIWLTWHEYQLVKRNVRR